MQEFLCYSACVGTFQSSLDFNAIEGPVAHAPSTPYKDPRENPCSPC